MSEGIKVDGKLYELSFEDAMADLTGAESAMLEDYLGGWENFVWDRPHTRSTVVLVWIAKNSAGETVPLAEIEQMKGLVFGNTVEVVDGPPSEAADAASASSAETSATNGSPGTPVATSATA